MDWPKFIAHRGASAIAPENTEDALQLAIELGAQCVEFDVQLSADGVPVIFHDRSLKRAANQKSKVSNHDGETLLAQEVYYQFGPQSPAPTIASLDQYLNIIEDAGIRMNLEIKCFNDHGKHVAVGLFAYDARLEAMGDHCIVTSGCMTCLRIMRARNKQLRLGCVTDHFSKKVKHNCEVLNCSVLTIDHKHIDEYVLGTAKHMNMAVLAYTVNNFEKAKSLIQQGVSSIFSDVIFPEKLIKELK